MFTVTFDFTGHGLKKFITAEGTVLATVSMSTTDILVTVRFFISDKKLNVHVLFIIAVLSEKI